MPLPHRKKQTKKPTGLPKEFLGTVSDLFRKQFSKKLAGATFLVYGDLFSNEAVLAVSLTHPKSLPAASLHISADLPEDVAENPAKVTERLKGMVDVAASWFAQCLDSASGIQAAFKEMEGVAPTWQAIEWEGGQLFVKVDRTNYTLEKAAAEFLKKKGFAEEGDDILDGDDLDKELEDMLEDALGDDYDQ